MKRLDNELFARLRADAVASPRRRAHHNLHPELGDPIQRLCMALECGTYIRPHRHPEPGKFELLTVLAGRVALICFDAGGAVTVREELACGGAVAAAETPPGAWHTLAALEPGSIVLEVKPGPYAPAADKDFAAWAPVEGEPAAARFENWFRTARPGERPPLSA
ncbi:MAG TPA: WbuC family cupin fold metalloprotein [Gammaproteobacteria bacterium]|jgi:cupin fold WbuC family metalloprotein|nr:WbuC family cupin fold metalloprotein [Gammaproteobacteria bacterium]